MNFRTFALSLAASLILASAAGAVEPKHHPRAEDRQMSAKSYSHYWQDDRSNASTSEPDALNRDPLSSSANGS